MPGERVAFHAALARALEGDPGLAVGAHGAAAQHSTHWLAAHEPARALAASVQAGVEAEQVWSFEEANARFEHAVELWAGVAAEQRPDSPSLVELGRRGRGDARTAATTTLPPHARTPGGCVASG